MYRTTANEPARYFDDGANKDDYYIHRMVLQVSPYLSILNSPKPMTFEGGIVLRGGKHVDMRDCHDI